jgi:hypothetical protein
MISLVIFLFYLIVFCLHFYCFYIIVLVYIFVFKLDSLVLLPSPVTQERGLHQEHGCRLIPAVYYDTQQIYQSKVLLYCNCRINVCY